jgi:Protein of unknown function (DUF1573)
MSMCRVAWFRDCNYLLIPAFFLVMQVAICAGAELTFNSDTVEFVAGVEKNGETASFQFVNKSNETITIQDIQTGCGCMSAELEKRKYEPGEEGTLSIHVDFREHSGPLRKKVKVVIVGSDPASKREQHLQINGTVLSPFSLSAIILAWKIGEVPEPKKISITRNPDIAIDQIKIEPSSPLSPFSLQVEYADNGNISITLAPKASIGVDGKAAPLDGREVQHAYYLNYRHVPSNTQKRERFYALIHR